MRSAGAGSTRSRSGSWSRGRGGGSSPGARGFFEGGGARAEHEIGRRGVDAEPVGFLVEGTRRVYFAGDTDFFERMAEVGGTGPRDGIDAAGERLDLALLPVW